MTSSNGVARLKQVKAKALQTLGLIKHAKKFLPSSDLQKCVEESLSLISGIVARFWAVVENLNLTLSKDPGNSWKNINNPYNASAAPSLQSLGWLSIQDLIRKEAAMLTHKSLNLLAPQYLMEIFTKCSEGYVRNLRSNETNFEIPLLRTSMVQNTFVQQNYGMSSAEKLN